LNDILSEAAGELFLGIIKKSLCDSNYYTRIFLHLYSSIYYSTVVVDGGGAVMGVVIGALGFTRGGRLAKNCFAICWISGGSPRVEKLSKEAACSACSTLGSMKRTGAGAAVIDVVAVVGVSEVVGCVGIVGGVGIIALVITTLKALDGFIKTGRLA
jgi:hypothetical protein